MGFKLVIMRQGGVDDSSQIDQWPKRLKEAVPGIEVDVCDSVGEAMEVIKEADAAFGNIVPELLERARSLKWITCPQAGPRAGYYTRELIAGDVVVTNTRGIYNEHIGAHIMSFVLAFAKGLHVYIPQQAQRRWQTGYEAVYLPDATAVVVGVGGIGGEAARLCAEFGMYVIGVDPRQSDAPKGVSEMHPQEALDRALPRADFVIVTVPETPETQGLFNADKFALMRRNAFFINIGRGANVILDDLVAALETGQIAGAGLDVFQVEPLPKDHPLWTAPGAIITPHVAAVGPYLDDRRAELFIDNCIRFNEGRPLRNVVEKEKWF